MRSGNYEPAVWQALSGFRDTYSYIESAVYEFFMNTPPEAVVAIKACLASEDLSIAFKAAVMLYEMRLGQDDNLCLSIIHQCLMEDNMMMRVSAAQALQRLKKADVLTAQTLIGCIKLADDNLTKFMAQHVLYLIAKANLDIKRYVISQLSTDDEWLRFELACSLQNTEAPEAVDALVSLLKSNDKDLVIQATQVLNECNWANDKVMEIAKTWLAGPNLDLRIRAGWMLYHETDILQSTLLPAIEPCLSTANLETRWEAALLYKLVDEISENVVNALTSCQAAQDFDLCIRGAALLGDIGREDKIDVDTLFEGLARDDDKSFFDAENVLLNLSSSNHFVIERMAAVISSQVPNCLIACQKLEDRQTVTDIDISALLDVVNVCERDEIEHLRVRRWFFSWIRRVIEPSDSDKDWL